MPRYHFDIEDRPAFPDHDGTDLADDEAARKEAIKLIGAYLKDHPDPLLARGEIGVHVRRPDRRTVFVVSCIAVDTSGA
jgi:hypothetical protein